METESFESKVGELESQVRILREALMTAKSVIEENEVNCDTSFIDEALGQGETHSSILVVGKGERAKAIVVMPSMDLRDFVEEDNLLDALAEIREMTFEIMEIDPEFQPQWLAETVSDPMSIPPMVKAALSQLLEGLSGQSPPALINWLVKAARDYRSALENKHHVVQAFHSNTASSQDVRQAHQQVEDAHRSLELALEATQGHVDETMMIRLKRLEAVANAARQFVLDTSSKKHTHALEKSVCDLDILGVEC